MCVCVTGEDSLVGHLHIISPRSSSFVMHMCRGARAHLIFLLVRTNTTECKYVFCFCGELEAIRE